jgi:hypothetical protein
MVLLLLVSCAPADAAATIEPTQEEQPDETSQPDLTDEPVVTASTPAEETPEETATAEDQPTATPKPQSTESTDVLESEDELIELRIGNPSSAMESLVKDLADQGVISTAEGQYFQMNDLILRWARINWYKAWFTPIGPDDFVASADVKWFAASRNANAFNSGCGFSFRAADQDHHYMAFIALDGYVYLWRVFNGRPAVLGQGWYNFYSAGEKNEEGIWISEAHIDLAVEGMKITFFVNGEEVITRHDPVLEEGQLALALASGINSDFGTQCEFTNTEFFVLDHSTAEN